MKLKLLLFMITTMIIVSACGNLYEPKKPEIKNEDIDEEAAKIEEIKERVKAEFEEKQNDTRYPVMIGDMKWGYINDRGGLVIGPVYDSASYFVDGLASVSDQGQAFAINISGDVVIDDDFIELSQFSDSYGVFRKEKEDGFMMGFVTSLGLVTEYPEYDCDVDTFSEGIVVVERDGLYSFMNTAGELITDEFFEMAFPFSEGMALVVNNKDKYGYINVNGELVIPFEYSYSDITTYYQGFHDGLAAVKTGGRYGYINKQGDIAIEAKYDFATPFSDRRASVTDGKVEYFINTEGEKPFDSEYFYATKYENGYAYVKLSDEDGEEEFGGFSLVNTAGEVVTTKNLFYEGGGGESFHKKWSDILPGGIGRLAYYEDGVIKHGYYDLKNNEVIWE